MRLEVLYPRRYLMSDPQPSAPHDDAPDGLPSQGVRTVVSLLLVFHLFALLVAIGSNSGDLSSSLQLQLRRVPLLMNYLQFLDMDLSYNFALTQDTILDIDHAVTVEFSLPDGGSEQVSLPDDSMWPGTRYRRYQRLAENMADLALDPDREALLPRAIAASVMSRHGVDEATITCRGHYILRPEDVYSSDLSLRDPYHERRYRTVYSAKVLRDGDQVGLVKTSSDELPGESPNAPSSTAPVPVQTQQP